MTGNETLLEIKSETNTLNREKIINNILISLTKSLNALSVKSISLSLEDSHCEEHSRQAQKLQVLNTVLMSAP